MGQQQYSGPIPPASEFLQYEKVLDGSADRILTMAEKEQKSQISDRTITGMTMLFATLLYYLVIIGLIIATVILGIKNQPIIAIGTSITALATASPKIITAIKQKK